MNYLNVYNSIITRSKLAKRSKLQGYFENHHIIPKCLGGSNASENLTLLTAKEHFVCHHLLTKIHPDSKKLHYAFWMTLHCTSSSHSRYKTTGSAYQIAKEKHIKYRSDDWKLNNPNLTRSNKGENNPMYGTHRTGDKNPFFGKSHTPETKQKNKFKELTKSLVRY